uniref:Uncharacterized protein n=1 Tax=Rhizophagus irregularis (strain DAOM 181602 / DAOM 197198 / MUCL 43194) TaxID=747089 RepID=U9UQ85_RHIID
MVTDVIKHGEGISYSKVCYYVFIFLRSLRYSKAYKLLFDLSLVAMQISIFYTRDDIICNAMLRKNNLNTSIIMEFLCTIYNDLHNACQRRITRPYKFIIPDSDDQVYVLVEIVEKIQVIDYYLKLQEISRKFHNYTPSNEVPCSKTTDIVQDIIKKFKEFLKKMLVEFSKEEINEIHKLRI